MKKKYILGGMLIGSAIIGVLGVLKEEVGDHFRESVLKENNQLWENETDYYGSYKKACLQYIENTHFLNREVIYTQDVISLMTYYLKEDNQEKFDQLVEFTKTYLINHKELVLNRYYTRDKMINDQISIKYSLEFIQNLLQAYNKWDSTGYREIALSIEKGLYDVYNNKMSQESISLGEYNLKSIIILWEYNEIWEEIYNKAIENIENAYINETFPFYKTNYSKPQVLIEEQSVDMEKTLQIVLELSKVGKIKEETINWLIQTLSEGKLYKKYSLTTGKPIDYQECVLNYALVAQIGKNIRNTHLHTLAIEKMLKMQLKDSKDQNYGAFKDGFDEKIIIYKNIQGLLAF